jgi:hypothetical protein
LQVFDPEYGPLEQRIGQTQAEALTNDAINIKETAYWFSTPPGMWHRLL